MTAPPMPGAELIPPRIGVRDCPTALLPFRERPPREGYTCPVCADDYVLDHPALWRLPDGSRVYTAETYAPPAERVLTAHMLATYGLTVREAPSDHHPACARLIVERAQ